MSDSLGIKLARADGGVQSLTPVGTTLSGAPTVAAGITTCVPTSGQVAVALPQNSASPLIVFNNAASQLNLSVFPPTSAGKINAGTAGAALSVWQNQMAVFYPLSNGVDFVAFTPGPSGWQDTTPVGTTLSGAPTLNGSINTCTAASGNTAVLLPQNAPAFPMTVFNTAATAVNLLVFPPTSGGKINAGSAGASFTVAQNKAATFYPLSNGTDWVAVLTG